MMSEAVYILRKVSEDPRYQCFFPKSMRSRRGKEDTYSDFMPDDATTLAWQPPHLASLWKPLQVVGRVRSYDDFPTLGGLVPVFSQRAVDALADMLEPNGELLPLATGIGRYYAYNVTTVVDALDRKRSEITFLGDTYTGADTIRRYVFFPDKVKGLAIFRIPDMLLEAYVTERFVTRVEEYGLQGFEFAKVWPLPAGARWDRLARLQRKVKDAEGLRKGQTPRGNSIRIELGYDGVLLAADRQRIKDLLTRLDQLLADPHSRKPAVGQVEEHKAKRGCYHICLSCPVAGVLVTMIRPLLAAMPWRGSIRLVQRNGHYAEAADEKTFVVR